MKVGVLQADLSLWIGITPSTGLTLPPDSLIYTHHQNEIVLPDWRLIQ